MVAKDCVVGTANNCGSQSFGVVGVASGDHRRCTGRNVADATTDDAGDSFCAAVMATRCNSVSLRSLVPPASCMRDRLMNGRMDVCDELMGRVWVEWME